MMVAAAWLSCFLERVEPAEVALERLGQLALGLAPTLRHHVLPEQRVEDVSRQVEGQRLLERGQSGEVGLVTRLVELLERLVGAFHVGRVVLVVMKLHDAPRDVRLERRVVVWQLG